MADAGPSPMEMGKSVLTTVKAYINLEQTIQNQQTTILELNRQVERLANNVVVLSERLAILETTVKADRETNAEETRRIISEFIADVRLKLKDAELQAERDKNAQLLQLLAAKSETGA